MIKKDSIYFKSCNELCGSCNDNNNWAEDKIIKLQKALQNLETAVTNFAAGDMNPVLNNILYSDKVTIFLSSQLSIDQRQPDRNRFIEMCRVNTEARKVLGRGC